MSHLHYSDRGSVRFALGDMTGAIEDYTEAIRQFSIATQTKPPKDMGEQAKLEAFIGRQLQIFALYHYWRAKAYAQSGDKNSACGDFQQALRSLESSTSLGKEIREFLAENCA